MEFADIGWIFVILATTVVTVAVPYFDAPGLNRYSLTLSKYQVALDRPCVLDLGRARLSINDERAYEFSVFSTTQFVSNLVFSKQREFIMQFPAFKGIFSQISNDELLVKTVLPIHVLVQGIIGLTVFVYASFQISHLVGASFTGYLIFAIGILVMVLIAIYADTDSKLKDLGWRVAKSEGIIFEIESPREEGIKITRGNNLRLTPKERK